MSYGDFLGVVAGGRKNVNTANENVMPAFGTNKNVMCVIDDIYGHLRARANDAVPRGRPAKHEEKPDATLALRSVVPKSAVQAEILAKGQKLSAFSCR